MLIPIAADAARNIYSPGGWFQVLAGTCSVFANNENLDHFRG